MGDSEAEGLAVERQLALQDEIDLIVAEIEERRGERSRSRFVTMATLLFAVPLFWAIDLPGLPGQLALLVIGLIGFYAAWSFAYAELSTIGFFASAKQRLDILTSQEPLSQDSEP
jgi:fatty acid desaturase